MNVMVSLKWIIWFTDLAPPVSISPIDGSVSSPSRPHRAVTQAPGLITSTWLKKDRCYRAWSGERALECDHKQHRLFTALKPQTFRACLPLLSGRGCLWPLNLVSSYAVYLPDITADQYWLCSNKCQCSLRSVTVTVCVPAKQLAAGHLPCRMSCLW